MTEQTAFTLAASCVGFVAAIFFCVGNAFNSVDKITLQSTMFWDFSDAVARALASQRAQYVTGGVLLLASFFLQVLAAVSSSTDPANVPLWLQRWQIFGLAILVPTLLGAWLFYRLLNRVTIRKVLENHNKKLEAQVK